MVSFKQCLGIVALLVWGIGLASYLKGGSSESEKDRFNITLLDNHCTINFETKIPENSNVKYKINIINSPSKNIYRTEYLKQATNNFTIELDRGNKYEIQIATCDDVDECAVIYTSDIIDVKPEKVTKNQLPIIENLDITFEDDKCEIKLKKVDNSDINKYKIELLNIDDGLTSKHIIISNLHPKGKFDDKMGPKMSYKLKITAFNTADEPYDPVYSDVHNGKDVKVMSLNDAKRRLSEISNY
ncbi:uncharacterized protein LOC122498428 [Leptopilina heterotoma]|uniref:uncharacterized protein LOC122498428 n=1 Tax=Leptopilina heterotoma TaxID=63436 RepID=UPI001CAA359D|nr:uncharacterized protein LOC122498428 [Leptopilina heterotoma]